MMVLGAQFISGVMVGFEVFFPEDDKPYSFSMVLDLFIIRFVIQKLKV